MIKLLGATLIIFSCWVFGLSEYNRQNSKLKFISGLIDGLEYIRNEMMFSKPVMSEILKKCSYFSGKAGILFLNLSEEIDSKNITVGEAYDLYRHLVKNSANASTDAVLKDVISQIGSTDAQTQSEIIGSGIEKLKILLKSQNVKCEKEGTIYKKTGVIAGVGIVVLLL